MGGRRGPKTRGSPGSGCQDTKGKGKSQKQKEGEWIDEISTTPFWVGPFDFPMIENLRLPSDQRCAFVLNNFTKGVSANFSLISFPGSYASLKEKPYYQDIVRDLVASSKEMKQ